MLSIEELKLKLIEARNNAYAPYSKFYVGAVLECNDGTILLGSNVENASYGLAMCAERNVLFQAYNKGYRKGDFKRLSIIADSSAITFPCGACRQVIVELLDENSPILCFNLDGNYKELSIEELMPYQFNEGNLK